MIHFASVTKQYGRKILYRNANFQINPQERIGLVGPNGAGKTTIFRLVVKEEGPDEGVVTVPDKIKVGYFCQNIEEMKGRTVLGEVLSAVGEFDKIREKIQAAEQKLSDPNLSEETMTQVLEEYGELQSEFERIGGYGLEAKVTEILGGLGLGSDTLHQPTEHFSGGWKMRIALAKILAIEPDVLLMDEPTNHLDLESILWLENWLQNFKGAIVMTCHDRVFMNRLVTKIVEVAYQTITSYSGNYDFYERERDLRKEQLVASAKRQEEMLAKEQEFIARFAARASHAAQVQSRVKKIEKIERIEIPAEEKVIDFEWPVPPRGGDEVVKFEDLGKTWKNSEGKEKIVFKHANALVKRLDRIAVVGVNGAGKSTLMKIIVGDTPATEGKCTLGASIEVGYFSQNSLDVLDPKLTIIEEVHKRFPTANLGFIRNLLGALKFTGDEAEKKISVLSGGEKSRVVLATILARPVNFLVLDEPTNHLDIASREVLLKAVKNFPGTVMVVSHDRHFLGSITTRVFELDLAHLNIFDGSWDYYMSKKAK